MTDPSATNAPSNDLDRGLNAGLDAGLDLGWAGAYGSVFAEVYDRWYGQVTDAEATARFVDSVAPSGPVLELGVGTGRLAGPLTDRGRTVVGLDSSAEMLDLCPSSAALRLRADMRTIPLPDRRFAAVLIAFNTLFNLATVESQRSTLAEARRAITGDGVVVVEAIDGSLLGHSPSSSIGISHRFDDGIVVSATVVDPDAQTISGRHLEIGDGGVTVRPWRLRWLSADQLDEMAAEAGLVRVARRPAWSPANEAVAELNLISVYARR